jgi:hypothetical protein
MARSTAGDGGTRLPSGRRHLPADAATDPNGFTQLLLDIKEHGVQEPITPHHDGTILDGRNCYVACRLLDLECQGERTDLASNEARLSQTKVADLLNISRSSIQRAKAAEKRVEHAKVHAKSPKSMTVAEAVRHPPRAW